MIIVLLLAVLLFPLVRASASPRVLFRFLSKLLVYRRTREAAAALAATPAARSMAAARQNRPLRIVMSPMPKREDARGGRVAAASAAATTT